MSLHASMSSEAKAQLEAQKRTSTIFSVIISILSMALLALLLYVISITVLQKKTPELTSYGTPTGSMDDTVEETAEPEVTDTPTPPSSATSAKVITAISATSDVAAPQVTVDTTDLEFDLGEEIDFEFDTSEAAEVSTTLSDFGASTRIPGTIGGYFYDFKQTRARVPVKNYERDPRKNYVKRVKKLHRGRFSSKSLANHFKSDQELFIRYIAIPRTPAVDGPKYFGVEKLVKPKAWIVHYKGKVVAPRDGTFRFVGFGDDYLAVGVGGKPHLVTTWSNLRSSVVPRGLNAKVDPPQAGPFGGPSNGLLSGRWFSVKKGDVLDIDIAFGEDPGGSMGYLLLIEEKGVKYQKREDGGLVLPPFTVGELSEDDINKLKAFPGWKFKLDDVPVFEAQH